MKKKQFSFTLSSSTLSIDLKIARRNVNSKFKSSLEMEEMKVKQKRNKIFNEKPVIQRKQYFFKYHMKRRNLFCQISRVESNFMFGQFWCMDSCLKRKIWLDKEIYCFGCKNGKTSQLYWSLAKEKGKLERIFLLWYCWLLMHSGKMGKSHCHCCL